MPDVISYINTDAYQVVNQMAQERLGEETVLNEDLSNIIDVGTRLRDTFPSVDAFTGELLNRISVIRYVNRVYKAKDMGLNHTAIEWGLIIGKVDYDPPEATKDNAWDLQDGMAYNEDLIFTKPIVREKFFQKRVAYRVKVSITKDQVKTAFTGPQELLSFFAMITTKVENEMAFYFESLSKATVNTLIGGVIKTECPDGVYTNRTGVRFVNVLHEFNQRGNTSYTKDEALVNPEFWRYFGFRLRLASRKLTNFSTKYNAEHRRRHTPADMQRIVLLDYVKESVDTYLQSDTFHDEFTKLPGAFAVSYWQGDGDQDEPDNFDISSKIDVTLPKDITKTENPESVSISGVMGVIFDHDAAGIAGINNEVYITPPNGDGNFSNMYNRHYAGYFIDMAENAVVFYMA